MTVLPLVVTTAVKHLYHWLRKIAYEDMARQASGWVQGEYRVDKPARPHTPIKLDFGIPKKHRLAWMRRTIHHLPH